MAISSAIFTVSIRFVTPVSIRFVTPVSQKLHIEEVENHEIIPTYLSSFAFILVQSYTYRVLGINHIQCLV